MRKFLPGLGLGLVAAGAAAAFFFSVEAIVDSNGVLVVSFDEHGLGNTNVIYNLTGSANGVYACLNKGGDRPQTSNKVGPAEFSVTTNGIRAKNGRIVSSITAPPPESGTLVCPSSQLLKLVCVNYSNLVLTDVINNVYIEPTGTTSRTLISRMQGVSCS